MKYALLVNLPQYDTIAPPAALGILAAVCAENKWEYEIFDYNIKLYHALSENEQVALSDWLTGITTDYHALNDSLKEKLINCWQETLTHEYLKKFDIVAISVFSIWSLRIAQLLLPILRKSTHAQIVLGGNGCVSNFIDTKDSFKKWVLDNKLADFIVSGDGEPTFSAILQDKTVNIPGINNCEQKYDWDINAYPIPDYSKFDLSLYSNRKIYITGSRGCVRNCTFCDIGKTWPKFRYRNAHSIVDEIKKHYYELGIENFDFTDSLINGSISNFYKFNTLLAEEKAKNSDLKNISYIGQFICRPQNQMPSSHYEAMHYAGCSQLTVGIESFSERVRMHMKKKFSNADIDYHIHQSSYWGIRNVWLMICGYPTETSEDHQDNLTGIQRYKQYAKQGIIELIVWGSTMHMLEGTPMVEDKMRRELGINMHQTDNDMYSIWDWTSDINPDLTLAERIRRRVEVHEYSVACGYPQPRVRMQLSQLRNLAMAGAKANFLKKRPTPVIMIKKENI